MLNIAYFELIIISLCNRKYLENNNIIILTFIVHVILNVTCHMLIKFNSYESNRLIINEFILANYVALFVHNLISKQYYIFNAEIYQWCYLNRLSYQ